MRVLEANTVTILPTNRCTAQCRHCSMNAGPDRKDMLSWPELENIINQLYDELKHLEVVVFSGGESTMLGEDLHRAIRLCKQRNDAVVVRLVTNAFWATSAAAAEEVVRALKEAGLDELNISTDDYHLPYISLQRVRYAWNAANKMGFLSLAITNASGPESWVTPERVDAEFASPELDIDLRFDEDGAINKRDFRWDQTNLLLSNMKLYRLGRKKEKLFEGETTDISDKLPELGDTNAGCPWAIRSAAVSAKGHFVSCCGFEVEENAILDYGSIQEHGLAKLMDKADDDLISNMIALIGPPQLKRILEQIAPDEVSFPRADYSSYCEVCEDLVGIEQNRQALYNYQSLFFDAVMDVREELVKQFATAEGRVRIPGGTRVPFKFIATDPTNPADEPYFIQPRSGPENARLIPLGRLTQGKAEPRPVAPNPCRGR